LVPWSSRRECFTNGEKGFGDHEIWRHDVVDISAPKIHPLRKRLEPRRWRAILDHRQRVSQAVLRPTVSFERAVELAFPGADTRDLSRWTVTCRFAASDPSHGKLEIDEAVTVKSQGRTFEVVTDRRLRRLTIP
jgi:hypothetical protein